MEIDIKIHIYTVFLYYIYNTGGPNMQNKSSEAGSRNKISRLLGAYNVGFNKSAYRKPGYSLF